MRSVLLGLFYNLLVMIGCAVLYGLVLVHLVTHFHWAAFFGEFWFFALESLALPTYLFLRNKKTMAAGALLSVAPYFLVVLPLAFIRGD